MEHFIIRYSMFSLGTDLGQQITHLTFFVINSYNTLTCTKCAVLVQVLCIMQ